MDKNVQKILMGVDKLKLKKTDILVIRSDKSEVWTHQLQDIHNALMEKNDWTGTIILLQKDENVETLGDKQQKELYKILKSKYDPEKPLDRTKTERRKYPFRMFFDKLERQVATMAISDPRSLREVGVSIPCARPGGKMVAPNPPGRFIECQAEVTILIPAEKKKGEVTLEKNGKGK